MANACNAELVSPFVSVPIKCLGEQMLLLQFGVNVSCCIDHSFVPNPLLVDGANGQRLTLCVKVSDHILKYKVKVKCEMKANLKPFDYKIKWKQTGPLSLYLKRERSTNTNHDGFLNVI